jgi:hypothetical protein
MTNSDTVNWELINIINLGPLGLIQRRADVLLRRIDSKALVVTAIESEELERVVAAPKLEDVEFLRRWEEEDADYRKWFVR